MTNPDFKWRPRGQALTTIAAEPPKQRSLPPDLAARFEKPKATFKPSPQQADFFEWVANGKGSCVLEAVAGAGKTTTLIQALRLMEGSVFFGAYNKSIAGEIKIKAKEAHVDRPGIYMSTMHGVGFAACNEIWKKVQVDDRKVSKLLKALDAENPALGLISYASFIGRMVSFGKQFLIGCKGKPAIDNLPVWLKLMDHFSVDMDLPEDVDPDAILQHVMEVYRRSHAQCTTIIDFDDMIYAPIAYNLRLFRNDWVLVDEAQDINPARRELAKRLLKPNGRAVFVGDSRQAIYGFTGAGGDALSLIQTEFNCVRLPLTVTYRCPKTVVEYVHQWVSHIQAHPDAPDGVVRPAVFVGEQACEACSGPSSGNQAEAPCAACNGLKRIPAKPWFIQDPAGITDAILCRYTRPLIQTAYSMIREGIACKVEGRDIGNGLIALAKLWKISTITRLEERLKAYLKREIEKAQAAGSDKREQEVTDKVATLMIFIERCRQLGKTQIDDLVFEIQAMFADGVAGVITLSTGHKAKGREWGRVYWIQTAQRGRPSKQWELDQEQNVKYVIGTRAMKELILVPESLV